VIGPNGKIKPNWVLVNGIPQHHPEGNYYIHKYEGEREIWKKAGPNPADAVNAMQYEKTLRAAIAAGIHVKQETPPVSIESAAWVSSKRLSSQGDPKHIRCWKLR
jgi:hypothetical protein